MSSASTSVRGVIGSLGRLAGLLIVCTLALQLYFLARVALMTVVDPQSTAFQRSEIRRLLVANGEVVWSQQWVADEQISKHLKRAVIASEDASFASHTGVEWEALQNAWEKNQRAEERADRLNERAEREAERQAQRQAQGQAERDARRRVSKASSSPAPREVAEARRVEPKLIGGSTITQQLAKNLFLSGERSVPRKAQEFVITFMLEAVLGKRRILEIYLNNVEWGEGVFGAQAAARHYFRTDAAQLGVYPSARLAVMLPAPKRFEKRPGSSYVSNRASTIAARMGGVEAP
jgi:monofunctional glycosyltransferase